MKDRELWKVEEVRRSLWLKENSLDIPTEEWVRFCQAEMEVVHTQQETMKTKAHA